MVNEFLTAGGIADRVSDLRRSVRECWRSASSAPSVGVLGEGRFR